MANTSTDLIGLRWLFHPREGTPIASWIYESGVASRAGLEEDGTVDRWWDLEPLLKRRSLKTGFGNLEEKRLRIEPRCILLRELVERRSQ